MSDQNKKVKKWLGRAYKIDNEINILQKELEDAFSLATKCTSSVKDVCVEESKTNSSEQRILQYISYSEKINAKIDELYAIKQEISQAIFSVDDSILRQLLILRYLHFKKWGDIANELSYDYYHVRKILHKKALESIKIPPNTLLKSDNI